MKGRECCFDRESTNIVKGMLLLLMFILHFFCFPCYEKVGRNFGSVLDSFYIAVGRCAYNEHIYRRFYNDFGGGGNRGATGYVFWLVCTVLYTYDCGAVDFG